MVQDSKHIEVFFNSGAQGINRYAQTWDLLLLHGQQFLASLDLAFQGYIDLLHSPGVAARGYLTLNSAGLSS